MIHKPTFKLSNCVAHHTKDWEASAQFYQHVMGLNVQESESHLEIKNEKLLLYIQDNPNVKGTVLEFVVDDVEEAKAYLLSQNCKVIKWEGKGKDCFMIDPFGLIFNLWEKDS